MDSYTLQISFRQMSEYLTNSLKQISKMPIKLSSMEDYDEFWKARVNVAKKEVKEMKRKNYQIIITKKEELIALIIFYAEGNRINDYKIINQEERYLTDFPTKDSLCIDFYMAYCISNDEDMQKVYQKYIK